METWTTATATSAGVYDSLLGGKDNNAADRAAVAAAEQAYPLVRAAARNNRAFLARAVTWAAQQGIRQFLDLGCGFPTVIHDGQGRPVPLTGEAAGEEARVCYVDTSLLVVRFAEALRAGPGRTAHRADLRDADRIWQECSLDGWDLSQPVCVILGLVAQYFPAAEFGDITARYMSRMQAGSVMIVSAWACADGGLASRLSQSHPADLYPHTAGDVSRFLGGTELVAPGVTWARAWRAGWGHERVNGAEVHVLGAVGVVP